MFKALPRSASKDAIKTASALECGFLMLPHGQFTLVDKADLKKCGGKPWRIGSGYAKRAQKRNGKWTTQYLHRLITDAPDGVEIDHRNGNKLDNRRSNLRLCNRQQNLRNAKKTTRYGDRITSKFKGVRRGARDKRWLACGTKNYKLIPIGYFEKEIDAAAAYNKWALKEFGEFARVNDLP